MRFITLVILIMVSGCSEPASDSKKWLVSHYISEYQNSQNILEKKVAAYRIASIHWKEKDRLKWKKMGDDLTAQWRSENCSPGFKSNEEKRLLSEVTSTRVTFNDYSSIAFDYKSLFDLCGDESYLKPYAEFRALAEFSGNTNSICGEVVHTYSGEVVGRKIQSRYKELTSMSETIALKLGNQAVEGYGECMCVMHDYFKVKDNFSIGFCVGPDYFTCSHPQMSGAFCGESGDRSKLAGIVGDYEYRVPRGTSSYGSYASPGSTAADLLEWGKAQTESLVRDYCRGNSDC